MDAKITKLRLSRMLSYDWFKILLATAAIIVVWLLVFTMTATSIMPSQQFGVANYMGNVGLKDDFDKMNAAAGKNDVFSYEVIKRRTEDIAAQGNLGGEVLQARISAKELDVIFVADTPSSITKKKVKDEVTGEETYTYEYGFTYLEQFVTGYAGRLFEIDKYLEDMHTYLERYYGDENLDSSNLDESLVIKDFNKRAKKDKRYQKSSALKRAQKQEVERIQKYRDALVKFDWYLENNVVSLTETVIEDYFGKGKNFEACYAINLCPTPDKGGMEISAMDALRNAVAYKPLEIDGEGNLTKGKETAENMNLCIFDVSGTTKGYEYESLLYVVHVIEYYCPKKIVGECLKEVYA